MCHTACIFLTLAFSHQKLTIFAISQNTAKMCVLILSSLIILSLIEYFRVVLIKIISILMISAILSNPVFLEETTL